MTKINDITRWFHFYSFIVGLVALECIVATITSRTVGRIVTDPINFDSTEITSIEYPGLSSPQCLVILLSQPETFKTFCQLPTGGCILLSAAFPTNFNDTSEGHGYVCYTTSTPLIDRGRTWYMQDTASIQATPRTDSLQVASCSGRNYSQTTENFGNSMISCAKYNIFPQNVESIYSIAWELQTLRVVTWRMSVRWVTWIDYICYSYRRLQYSPHYVVLKK